MQRTEESGFYYLQSRYYDPNIGRFINADSETQASFSGTNLFLYCNNNPINRVDPKGHSWSTFLGKIKSTVKKVSTKVVDWAKSTVGVYSSSTVTTPVKPSIRTPSYLPVTMEHGWKSTLTVAKYENDSKPLVFHAEQDIAEGITTYSAGAKMNAFKGSIDLSGEVGWSNTGISMTTGYQNNSTSVCIRIDFNEARIGLEGSTSYKQDSTQKTDYYNISLSGIGLFMLGVAWYTGQVDSFSDPCFAY